MKIICTQENLRAGLQITSRIISSSNTLPILNNLLLKTENGLLKISSTNLEISIHTLIRCKVEEQGEVCIPAKTFTELVGTLPNKNITLTKEDAAVKVSTDNYTATVKSLSSDDFPLIPQVQGEAVVVFPTEVLKDALTQVLFAASTNETQPEISGVFMQGTGAGCKFVATDRYRLAEKSVTLANAQFNKGVIIPLRTAQEITKVLSGAGDTVEVTVGDNQILFVLGDTHIISRLIDGQYPDYEQIIPQEFATEARINRLELLQALRASGIFSHGSNSVRMEINPKGSVIVSSGSQDLGESVVTVESVVTGPETTVLFNYRYIQDMLANLDIPEVLVKVNSDSTPVVVTEPDTKGYIYLVMPIKT